MTRRVAFLFWSSYFVYFASGNTVAPTLPPRLNAYIGAARPSCIYITALASCATRNLLSLSCSLLSVDLTFWYPDTSQRWKGGNALLPIILRLATL
jgi:hypothetical protein